MRQTPFGVWNKENEHERLEHRATAMRQTPFGVWNELWREEPEFAD